MRRRYIQQWCARCKEGEVDYEDAMHGVTWCIKCLLWRADEDQKEQERLAAEQQAS